MAAFNPCLYLCVCLSYFVTMVQPHVQKVHLGLPNVIVTPRGYWLNAAIYL